MTTPTLEYANTDKSAWADGPWMREPDKRQWSDEATGLPCLIVRGPSGALCGYVGVSKGHPAHGKGYDDVEADVHGGLTFADSCGHGDDPAQGICHIPGPGEPDDVWWLGFDCAHYGDLSPAYDRPGRGGEYRTLPYVASECASLASQLALSRTQSARDGAHDASTKASTGETIND